jgi:hypothetical protein
MAHRLHYRPSGALIVACIALFVALGGVGYAAATIGSAQIKNNSVRSKDIRNNDVLGNDIRNNDVRGRDVRNDTLTGADVLEATLAKVPSASTADSASISKLIYKSGTFTTSAAGPGHGEVTCDPGTRATGGGVKGDIVNQLVQGTYPVGNDKWAGDVNDGGGTGGTQFTVYAICAPSAATG